MFDKLSGAYSEADKTMHSVFFSSEKLFTAAILDGELVMMKFLIM